MRIEFSPIAIRDLNHVWAEVLKLLPVKKLQ